MINIKVSSYGVYSTLDFQSFSTLSELLVLRTVYNYEVVD